MYVSCMYVSDVKVRGCMVVWNYLVNQGHGAATNEVLTKVKVSGARAVFRHHIIGVRLLTSAAARQKMPK